MYLTSGEAAHCQQAQRAMRQATRTARRDNAGRRVRVALATALIALVARLDATATLAQRQDVAVSPAISA